MNWTNFPLFASSATLFWILGMILLNFSGKRKAFEIAGNILIAAGLVVLIIFSDHFMDQPGQASPSHVG